MLLGNHEPRSLAARRRAALRPRGERLEARELLAVLPSVELNGAVGLTAPVVGGSLPGIAIKSATSNSNTGPFGVDFAGANTGEGDGFSVADIGDVNGDGYDDFLVGGPSITSGGAGGPLLGSGTATVYLIFGSRNATTQSISDWLNLSSNPVVITPPDPNTNQRVADLGQLGNSSSQQNPLTGSQSYPFDGIKFVTSLTPGSQLGASVASAGVINGQPAFLIGAPGALDSQNTLGSNGTGRAYLIYGGTALNGLLNKTIDLDNPAQNAGVTVITFAMSPTANQTGAQVGRSVAGLGLINGDQSNVIAIGAPTATSTAGLTTAGQVYLVSSANIPTSTQTVLLNTTGTSSLPGVVFNGAAAGDRAGFSVAPAGNVDGDTTSANQSIPDFLIGAPQPTTGAGKAYLVYGAVNLISSAPLVNGQRNVVLSNLNTTGNPTGLEVNGVASGDETGYSVSTAGDYYNSGVSDILIGSPFFNGSAGTHEGRADLIAGQRSTPSTKPLSGVVTLGALPATATSITFTGAQASALTGWSVGFSGKIPNTSNTGGNPILIGSPGYNNQSGAAYIVPPNPTLVGQRLTTNIDAATAAGVYGATRFLFTDTPGATSSFFGSSVSGILIQPSQKFTADGDLIADFIVGAPGYQALTGRANAGGGEILEGASLNPLQQTGPTASTITTLIGAGSKAVAGATYTLSATSPANLQIFIDSTTASNPAFNPFRDIDPTTVVVNSVAFPNATIVQDPIDENGDGIPDAIITITPRTNLNLTTDTTLTITGSTKSTSPNAGKTFFGQALISVTGSNGGGGGGGGTGGGAAIPAGTFVPSVFIPQFGPDQYVPSLAELSAYSSYKPIPLNVALRQYEPKPGFALRTQLFFHPKTVLHQFGSRHAHSPGRTETLGRRVFTRGLFQNGKLVQFTHEQTVVPTNLQRERLGSAGGIKFGTRTN
jgi:hypothetical protein